MKKILIQSLVILGVGFILLGHTDESFAACSNDPSSADYCNEADKASDASSAKSSTAPKETTIPTSERVPGAKCVQKDTGSGGVASRKYECTIPTGLAGFQTIFAQIIRWIINIVLLLGVLAVVGLGIAWSFAGGDDIKAKSTLKKWAINIIIGLIILFFFTYILKFLAPWVYQ